MTVLVVLATALLMGMLLAVALYVHRNPAPATSVQRDIVLLSSVVEIYPQSSNAWGDYIEALIAGGKYSEARRQIARARKTLTYDDGRVSLEEARLVYVQGDADGALKKADQVIAVAEKYRESKLKSMEEKGVKSGKVDLPALLGSYLLKAQIQTEQGDEAAAIESYTDALKESPLASDIMTARGELYLKTGDRAAAQADFETALNYAPTYQPALEGLDKLGVDSGGK